MIDGVAEVDAVDDRVGDGGATTARRSTERATTRSPMAPCGMGEGATHW